MHQKTNYLGIKIDYSKDLKLSEQALELLKKKYLREDEKSPQEGFARAAVAYSDGDMEFAQRIYDHVSSLHFMFSSPILSNAPLPGEKHDALPISCFLNYVPDTREGLVEHSTELRWLSMLGGGVGGHWSDVRSVCEKSPGPMPFIHTVDPDVLAYKQGKTRKGSYAAYMDISHPDIVELIQMRIPTGDLNRKNLNLHHGVNISDEFMKAVENDSNWDLIDPHYKDVRETLRARDLWQMILETRYRTGEPYLHFSDTSNRALPEVMRNKGLKIRGSNLCSEIFLPTDEKRTAVCCLSSLNIEKYDEWKESNLVADLIRLLDNVISRFIEDASELLSKAVYSAQRERSLGLGAMGLHYYFQSKGLPFGSKKARELNDQIFKDIKEKAEAETLRLGKIKGEAPDMKGTGRRNAHLLAIAPNANSGLIVGTSPSIETSSANAITSRTRVGAHLITNPYLKKVLQKHKKDTNEVWSSIISNKGSVQHLDFLTKNEKEVFKTAIEIDQMDVVTLAADRQKYLCQGQSLNVFFKPGESRANLHKVHFAAWKLGCKAMYYLRTQSSNEAEKVSEKIERQKLNDYSSQDECDSCQG